MFATATATMVLAFFVSWIIIRAGGKWKGFLDALVFMPLSVPGVVIALALLMAYLTPPLNSFGIYGTIWILVLGLMVIYLPFSTRLMNGAIVQLHKELEEAAHVSGATKFRTLIYVTLPLLFPAFAAGWVWVAVHALRAFPIPLMLAGRNNMVFSVLLWESWEEATAQAAAMGVILIIVLFPMTLLMRRFITQISGQQG
jgi:iron(III) transport system permease protein